MLFRTVQESSMVLVRVLRRSSVVSDVLAGANAVFISIEELREQKGADLDAVELNSFSDADADGNLRFCLFYFVASTYKSIILLNDMFMSLFLTILFRVQVERDGISLLSTSRAFSFGSAEICSTVSSGARPE